jgi:hypothetical protein
MACESDQWILTYQLSRSHDQGGSKTTSTKINVWQFLTPYIFLDVSSRFQYYLWLVDDVFQQFNQL